MQIDQTTSAPERSCVTASGKAKSGAWGSLVERIADGTYMADAHALAQSFLEYLEDLAGPA